METIKSPVFFSQSSHAKPSPLLFVAFAFCVITLVLSMVCKAENKIAPAPYPLERQIRDLIHKTTPDTDNGIAIMDAKTGALLYQHNAYQHFAPASTTKLLTAAAALWELKPEFRFPTSVFLDKLSDNGELAGNIYIRFSGDPSLKTSDLTNLVEKIHDYGIKKIKGNIILDNTVFDDMPYPQGMVLEDTQWWYGAPVTSIILNRNAVPVTINPDETLNAPVQVTVNEDASFFPVTTQVKSVTMKQAMEDCAFRVSLSDNNAINIKGCWPVSLKSAFKRVAIKNPDYYASQTVEQALKNLNITLTGTITTGKTPKNLKKIATHKSKPLFNLIGHMMTFSDDLYANALLKTLGAEKFKEQGSFFNGVKALKETLSKYTDINFDRMTLFDGAGMSTYNLITPKQLTQLLFAVFHSQEIKSIFMETLAKPFENGTLSRRMHTFGLAGNVSAKTGTLSGTTTLAGYITTVNDKNVIFSMMTNHYVGDIGVLKVQEDQIVSLIRSASFP